MKEKILIILLIFTILLSSFVFAEEETELDLQEKLNNISQEEKEILQNLFIQMQEIEEMERETKRIEDEIKDLKKDIETIDQRILEEEASYDKNLLGLKGVLSSYQRMGPGTYLEIILSSTSVSNLIRRINILRDLSKNTEKLLKTIEESKARLEGERDNLNTSKANLEDKYLYIEKNIKIKQELVKEQEAYLESLQEDKELYLERLQYIGQVLDELKLTIGEFTKGFNRILSEGRFPTDAVKQSITLRGIKGTIEEITFNEIINSYDFMPNMKIRLEKDRIELSAPDKDLKMLGYFQVEDSQTIKFIPEEGSFLDMPLEKATLDDLFQEGAFSLNLEPIIGTNIIKEVDLFNGYMDLLVGIKLF